MFNKKAFKSMVKQTIFVLVISLVLTSCTGKSGENEAAGQAQEHQVLLLSGQSTTIYTDYPASIQGQQVIEIRPKIQGYIEEIYVAEGAGVKKGQLLFRINSSEYEDAVRTAQAGIKSAEAELYAAQMEVKKVTPLVEKDIVSSYQLEAANYTLQAKEAALAQAKATLATAETNLGYTRITSPLDGVIGSIPYKTGALVSSTSSDPLTTLSDISSVFAYFSVNEKDFMDFHLVNNTLYDRLGNRVMAGLKLADGTDYRESGHVELASSLINTGTGSVSMKAIFENDDGRIHSGASAVISLPATFDSVLIVPQSATFEILNKRLIYKLLPDDKVLSVAISGFPTDDGKSFIVMNGLDEGDRVVTDGLLSLKDSIQIIPSLVAPSGQVSVGLCKD